MKEVNGYNISEKEFKQISKWAEDIYNITVELMMLRIIYAKEEYYFQQMLIGYLIL